MNGIFKNESSNIWIHPITQLNRYLIPIEWLTSLRNKPCCVADILQQTLSPIVICWVLSLSQPTPWRCTPSLRHGSSTDPVFPWWCVPATGTQQPLCVCEIPSLNPQTPSVPLRVGAKQAEHSSSGGKQFILLARQELVLACPQFEGVSPVFPTYLGFLLVVKGSSCPPSRTQKQLQVLK